MDKGQTVHQNGHIVAGVMVALAFLVLIDDLQAVVVNVLFVYELNVLGSSVISAEHLYMVGLNGAAFLNDAFVGIGKHFREETLPFAVGKGIVIEHF